jgi:hypothetical protein
MRTLPFFPDQEYDPEPAYPKEKVDAVIDDIFDFIKSYSLSDHIVNVNFQSLMERKIPLEGFELETNFLKAIGSKLKELIKPFIKDEKISKYINPIIENIILGTLEISQTQYKNLDQLQEATLLALQSCMLWEKNDDKIKVINSEYWTTFVKKFMSQDNYGRKKYIEFMTAYNTLINNSDNKKCITVIDSYFEYIMESKEDIDDLITLCKVLNTSNESEENNKDGKERAVSDIFHYIMEERCNLETKETQFLPGIINVLRMTSSEKLPFDVEKDLIDECMSEKGLKFKVYQFDKKQRTIEEELDYLRFIEKHPQRVCEINFILQTMLNLNYPITNLYKKSPSGRILKEISFLLNKLADKINDYCEMREALLNPQDETKFIPISQDNKGQYQKIETFRNGVIKQLNDKLGVK